MTSLKITRVTGEEHTIEITPLIEVAFESYFKAGIWKRLREEKMNSDVYWLAHQCLKATGADPQLPPYGDVFLATLKSADFVEEPAPKNG